MYSVVALISVGSLEVGKREERPTFGLEAHRRKRRKKGASVKVHWPSKGLVRIYLCGSETKYTKMNQGR